jgi:hypothetical protein
VMKSSANRADVVYGTPPKSRTAKAVVPPFKFAQNSQDENVIDAFLDEIDRLQRETPRDAAARSSAATTATANSNTPPRNSKEYRDRRSELVGLIRELVTEHDDPSQPAAPSSAASTSAPSSTPQTPRSRAKHVSKLEKDRVRLEQFG